MDYDEGDVVIAPGKRMGLISQIPVYPAGYTVEDVLATAFEPLREMEREMAALAEQMGEGTDPTLLARYDKLTAAFEAAGGYETDTKTNKVCNGLTIPQSMREQLFDKLSGGEKTWRTRTSSCWTSPPTTWTCGPPSGWRSTWTSSRERCSPSPTTGTSWTRW